MLLFNLVFIYFYALFIVLFGWLDGGDVPLCFMGGYCHYKMP